MGQRLARVRRLEDFLERVARTGQPLIRMSRVDGDPNLLPMALIQRGSANRIAGMNLARVERSQGMSMFLGFGMATVPIAPRRLRTLARSWADCM